MIFLEVFFAAPIGHLVSFEVKMRVVADIIVCALKIVDNLVSILSKVKLFDQLLGSGRVVLN